MTTYDILIPTIPHRHAQLCELLAELARQMQPGVGVRVYRDNLELSLREKNQALMESSRADYISWLDDDDWLAPGYLQTVMTILRSAKPDYIGFMVHWTVDGQQQVPVKHSLRYEGWENGQHELTRDITALNPIRRELALLGRWDFPRDHGADKAWAQQVAASGKVATEVYVPAPMYHYRFHSADSFLCDRQPAPEPLPPLPSYPWLEAL